MNVYYSSSEQKEKILVLNSVAFYTQYTLCTFRDYSKIKTWISMHA